MFYETLLANAVSCPECKSQMKEAERREENGATFVWFECSNTDCNGQWLRKVPSNKKRIAS